MTSTKEQQKKYTALYPEWDEGGFWILKEFSRTRCHAVERLVCDLYGK